MLEKGLCHSAHMPFKCGNLTNLYFVGGQVVICQSKNGNLVKGKSEIQQLIHDLPLQIADSSNIDIVNLQARIILSNVLIIEVVSI